MESMDEIYGCIMADVHLVTFGRELFSSEIKKLPPNFNNKFIVS